MFTVGHKIEIDTRKLRSEIRRVAKLSKLHKSKCRELRPKLGDLKFYQDIYFDRENKEWRHKDPAKDVIYKEWMKSSMESGRLALRITKLCALRALLRGKNHFGPNSQYLPQFDDDYVWKWVYPVAKEFSLASI